MKKNFVKRLLSTIAIMVAICALATVSASACTTIYVGGNMTDEGTPFVARTEDYGADMNKLWFISEAGHFHKGDRYLGCPEYGEFEWTFTHDSYRFTYFTNDVFNGTCPECGQKDPTHWSYTEFGTNEKGVSVSATETIYGGKEVTEVDPFVEEKKDGIVGIEETDIPTILLAEAGSAREGVELLAHIYDEYGACAASGLFICDQNEVWYIENCSGHQYVAIRLNNDIVFLEPNLAIIGLVDLDDENIIASKGLIETAKAANTYVGDEKENTIDFRASYANLGTAESPRVGAPRMVDGLKFLNEKYDYTQDDLFADNTKFTISNVKDGKIVPFYTNITPDRKLSKDDVFSFYQLSSVGKPSNQEIEIFQLFKNRPVETGTVGWVGVGNMANNVFVPYYPMLLEDIYKGYQVSTDVASFSTEKPDTFCNVGTSYVKDADGNWQRVSGYKAYPQNWRDSYYFTFEGLNGYIMNAEQLTGSPVTAADKQYVRDQLNDLQKKFNEEFAAMDPKDTTKAGKDMAERAHKLGLELIDYLLSHKNPFVDVKGSDYFYDAVQWAVAQGVTSGTDATHFSPKAACTRAQAVTFLWRAAGSPEPKDSANPFTDVKAGSYYEKAVLWAVENGITNGTSDTTFSPDAKCNRAQIVTFMWRAAKSPEDAPACAFGDVAAEAYYAKAVNWAVDKKVTSGTGADAFSPDADCTRAQIAAFLYRGSNG